MPGEPRSAAPPAPLAFAAPVRAHVLSEDEVVLLAERDRVALTGRAHAALAPLVDGTRTADELVDALAGTLPPALLHLALIRLQRDGHVVPVGDDEPAPEPPPQAPLPAARAARRSRLLRKATAIGVPRRWASRLDPAPDGIDPGLEVVLVDDYLRPELWAAVDAAAFRGGAVLPVRPVGRWLWFGPLFDGSDSKPGRRLFEQRLRLNRFADVVALEHGADFPLFPDDRSPATADLAWRYTELLVQAIADGAPPAALVDGLLTYDTVEGVFAEHALARIAPPREDDAPAFGDPLPAAPLHAEPTRFASDGGHRTVTPAETLARLAPLVSPITGVISFVDPVPAVEGMHIFSAAHPQSEVVTRPRGRVLGRAGGSQGKGFQEEQARVSCMGEAIEHYSGGFFGDEPRRTARLDEIADIAIGPEDLLLYSDAQYAAGPSTQAQEADAVPARFDATQAIEWVPVRSLVTGATRWLPAAYCYYGYGMSDMAGYAGAPFCVADSNGCAVGNTREEAILQGLMEAIERDACGIAWYNRARRPGIDLASFPGDPFAGARAALAGHGRELHVLDLTVDTEVPVAMAVSWDGDGQRTRFALGCHLDPRIAVSRAVSELGQLVLADPEADAALGELLFATGSIDEQPHLRPADGPLLRADALPARTAATIADELEGVCRRLAALGHDVLVLDQTRPEVGFPAVRVVVPGLRHFWRRLAPGRLYDVPVALGWRDAPLAEDELNPLPVLI
jgi:oxazoline/thiazoline synthase